MKIRNSYFWLAVVFILSAMGFIAPGDGGAAGTSGATPKSLTRKYDVIIVKGQFLRNYSGVPIPQLALFAYKNNSLDPIPFQIDERDPKGRLVMMGGKTAGKDIDNGKLDANDEMVFCAMDTGDRLPDAERADKIEIEITDPKHPSQHAWVYLHNIKSGKAPRSSVDYINYDPKTERIMSKNYILGYSKGYMFYSDVIYPASVGGNGKDFFDKVKFRIKVQFAKSEFLRNEDSVRAEVQGWIDGPVRVVQTTINYLKIFDMLPPVSFNSISEYYPYNHTSPIIVKFPFDLTAIQKTLGIKTIIADVIGDMPGLVGGNAYTNLYPQGFVYTGHSTPEDLKKIPKMGLVWGYATKKGVGTWFPRLIFPDVMFQFNSFYITDNESVSNPPDNVPGEIGAGLELNLANYPPAPQGISQMMKDSFMLKFETYFAPPGLTPDGAREWLDIQDYPLLVDIRAGSAVEKPPAATKVAVAPPWKTGRNVTITDVRERKCCLGSTAFFVGGIEVDARQHFPGMRISDGTYHIIPLGKINSITNYTMDLEPRSKIQMAMISKLALTDGTSMDLLGCRCCGWGGMDEEGRVVYFNNAQIKQVDFAK